MKLLARFVLLSAALAVLCGCASSGQGYIPWTSPALAFEPWKIPETAYPSQRLFRVRYQGPRGKVSFKLTLYLRGETHFRMRAADNLGRKVWDLVVDENDRALWLDHRNKQYCEASAASHLAVVPLARLPLLALPKLLLGHLPSLPAGAPVVDDAGVSYRDDENRLWKAEVSEDRLESWSLLEAGEAVTWWRREGDESVFEDVRGDQELRWRQMINEPLARVPPPLEIPARYESADCS